MTSRFTVSNGLDTYLRLSVAIIYIWFGALKLFGVSPASELATQIITFIPAHLWLLILGVWEVAIGICFLYRPLTKLGAWLFFPHLLGILSPLVLLPREIFTHYPLVPNLVGQYVIKNLLTVGIVLTILTNYRQTR